jgi:hypothetical protein
MGQDVRQNLALEGAVVKALLDLIEEELNDDPDEAEFRWLVTVGAYIAVTYVASLRGNEGFMLDLHALRKWFPEGKDDELSYIVLPLLGRFKGEEGERQHLFPVVSVTRSGINVRKWIAALIVVREKEGRVDGPAFCDTEGYVVSSREVDAKFRDLATTLQIRRPDLIRPETDVMAEISIARSLRRGAQSMAYAYNVSKSDQDVVNRWQQKERAKGRDPNRPMRARYADVKLLKPAFLRYTRVL